MVKIYEVIFNFFKKIMNKNLIINIHILYIIYYDKLLKK